MWSSPDPSRIPLMSHEGISVPGCPCPTGGAALPRYRGCGCGHPRVQQELLLCQPETPWNSCQCLQDGVWYLKTLKRRRSSSIFISSLFPLVILRSKLTNLALLLLIFEHHNFTRQSITPASCCKDFSSGEQGSCCGLQSSCKWVCWLTKQKLKPLQRF